MSNDYTPGLASFPELTITNTVGTEEFDISNIIGEVSYYEDIFSPAISATVMLIDALSLYDSLPIAGGELFKLRLRAVGDEDAASEISTKLTVYKTSPIEKVNDKTEAYSLFLTTNELLTNESHDRQVRRGTNSYRIDEVVRHIFKDNISKISNKKLLVSEETEGVFDYVFPSTSPFKAMNIMSSAAKSAKNISSNYVFFETAEGYHFTTLQSLLIQKPVETYYYIEEIFGLEKKSDLNTVKDYQKIIAVEQISMYDLLSSSVEGAFAGITKTLDVLSKSFFTKDYSYERDFKKVSHSIEKDPRGKGVFPTLTKESIKKFTASPTKETLITTNSIVSQLEYVKNASPEMAQSFIRTQEFQAIERAATEQLLSQKINIMVHGNPKLRAGQTVKLIFPLSSDTEGGRRQVDAVKSGRYLISAVAHRVDSLKKYVTVMECVKDSMEEQPEQEAEV